MRQKESPTEGNTKVAACRTRRHCDRYYSGHADSVRYLLKEQIQVNDTCPPASVRVRGTVFTREVAAVGKGAFGPPVIKTDSAQHSKRLFQIP